MSYNILQSTGINNGDGLDTRILITVATAIVATCYFFLMRDNNSNNNNNSSSSKKNKLPYKVSGNKFLNSTRKQVELIEKEDITHDVRRFRFALPKSAPVLGLPLGKCIKVYVPNIAAGHEEWNPVPESQRGPARPKDYGSGEGDFNKETGEWREEIVRKYTPCSLDCDVNYFDLILKVYFKDVNKRFPNGGKVSQYMNSLQVGDELQIAGPYGHIEYYGRSSWKKYGNNKTKLGMIAGGTGVTPMLQIIKAILLDKENDQTEISLLFANQTEDDILIRDMLEDWAMEYKDRFKIWYTLDRPPKDWEYSTGFIDDKMIDTHMPKPSNETLILLCGPPPMIKFACKPNLEKLGYDMKKMVAAF